MLARRYEFHVLEARTISHLFALLTHEILFLPLEPCNILYWYKFTVVYCESVNLIGYIIVCYLLIVKCYASVHIACYVLT